MKKGKKKQATKAKSTTSEAPLTSKPLLGLFLATLGILSIVAFLDYSPAQNSWIGSSDHANALGAANLVGTVGATLTFSLNYLVGLASWLAPVFLLWSGYLLTFRRAALMTWSRTTFMIISILSLAGIMSLIENFLINVGHVGNPQYYAFGPGGYVGYILYSRFLNLNLGVFGSTLTLLVVYLSGLILSFSLAPSAKETFEELFTSLYFKYKDLKDWAKEKLLNLFTREKADKPAVFMQDVAKPKKKASTKVEEPEEDFPEIKINNTIAEPKPKAESSLTDKLKGGLKIFASEETQKSAIAPLQRKGDYIFPPHDLLAPVPASATIDPTEHEEMAQQLVKTLSEFGVEVTPGEVHAGPVITRYEVIPAPGVRVEKIVNLDKNIALALKAQSVRILAPVPGKGSVGIEIPNKKPAPVCLREIIESTSWSESKAEIPVVLGKEVTGTPLVHDLTKMPHLLIAGSTGAGKTVCINTIIASLLYHSSPDDLRFIMVDPKIVEMQLYNDLPHMLIPVVTEPKKVPGALKWLIKEMEQRYQIFAASNVRNIAGFNAKILKDKDEKAKAAELEKELSPEERAALNNIEVPRSFNVDIPKEKMPYIVCIVDELADLMMVAPADIETCIARLAQLARAAGIHLILATQRPSVNVITGVIKANLPSRIAFKVASKVDSRTILDGGGADQLIGRGDMLFIPPGSSNLVRAQGAFLSDDEINEIVEALKVNGPPNYADEVQRQIELENEDGAEEDQGDWDDEMVPAAINVIRSTKRASTSMLQRRLKIGYNRAARIMDLLEAEGIVGPDNGQNPREILKDFE